MITSVTKANGTVVPFDVSKLRKWSEFASEGKVSWSEIELDAVKAGYDKMTTRELHSAMIAACTNRKDAKYAKMAARLLIGQLYKDAHGGFNSIPSLPDFVSLMEKKGLWEKMGYSEQDLKVLDKVVNHNKNLDYTYSILRQWADKYLVVDNVNKTVFESPQFAFMGIAMKAMQNQPSERRLQDVKTFYKYISDLKINLPSPYLTTMRTPIAGSASCCFPSGTEVDMKGCKKFIEDIVVGDEVVTSSGVLKKVTWLTNREYEGELYNFETVTTVKGKTWATGDHKYLVNREGYDLWVEASEVEKGDWIKTSDVLSNNSPKMLSDFLKDEILELGYEAKNGEVVYTTWEGKESVTYRKVKDFDLNSRAFGTLLGYYSAEGSTTKDKRRENSYTLRFTFGVDAEPYLEEVKEFFEEHNIHYSIIDTTEKDKCKTIRTSSAILAKLFIKLVGSSSSNKGDKSHFIRGGSEEFKLGFLAGFLRGDGCAFKNGYTVSSISKELLYSVRDIVQVFGNHGSLNARKFTSEVYPNAKEQYTLDIYANPSDELVKAVGKNVQMIKQKDPSKVKLVKRINDSVYVKVKVINTKPFVGTVYDFEVEDEHNFCVEGLVVHNCLFTADDTAESLSIANHLGHQFTLANAGIGAYLQTRSAGSGVKSNRIIHGGLAPYYRWMESGVGASKQSSRGGSATITFSCLEPDWADLIRLKNPTTPNEKRIDKLDYSVVVNTPFLKRAARSDGEWMLVSYHEAPELYEAMYKSEEEFEEVYAKVSRKRIKKKFVNAQKMLLDIVKQRFETGRIYLFFADNVNKHTPFKDTIYQSNLC